MYRRLVLLFHAAVAAHDVASRGSLGRSKMCNGRKAVNVNENERSKSSLRDLVTRLYSFPHAPQC